MIIRFRAERLEIAVASSKISLNEATSMSFQLAHFDCGAIQAVPQNKAIAPK